MDIKGIFLLYSIVFKSSIAGYCLYGSEPNCIFPCHCAVSSECGGPCTSCEKTPGNLGTTWTGPTCQIGNVAQSKNANQTGQYELLAATKAVDGVFYGINNCAHTDAPAGQYGRWWVDLGGTYTIYNITLYNRGDCCGHTFSYFSVGVIPDGGGTEVECGRYNQTGTLGAVVPMTCSPSLRGRYVHVARYNGTDIKTLVLCEVIVMGHRYTAIDCSSINCPGSCSEVTGCDTCVGSYQPYCTTPCEAGFYGTNCKETCGNCASGATCDVTSGACPGCTDGYHGAQCKMTCGRCLNKACSQDTGTCAPCEQWWADSKCTTAIVLPVIENEQISESLTANNSVTLKWEPLTSVPPDLGQYYQYVVKYKRTQDAQYIAGPTVKHTATPTATVQGLRHNTQYDVIIVPQRVMGSAVENNSNTLYGPIPVKTKCNLPVLGSLTINSQNNTKGQFPLIEVRFQEQTKINHGCDNITSSTLRYKRTTDTNSQTVSLGPHNTTYVITPTAWGDYVITLTATNNQGLEGVSSGSITIRNESITSPPGTSSPTINTTNTVAIVVPIVLLAVVGAAVAVGIVFYRRRKRDQKPTNLIKRPEQQHEKSELNAKHNIAFDNTVVGSENALEIVSEPTPKTKKRLINNGLKENAKVTPVPSPDVSPTPTPGGTPVSTPKAQKRKIAPKPLNIPVAKAVNTLDKPKKSDEVPIEEEVLYENSGVDVRRFEKYTANRKEDYKDFKAEYLSLPEDDKSRCITSQTDDNLPRNRFKNIFPYDNTRVHLAVKGEDGSDYINANYITGYNMPKEYIATQGPLGTTAEEFWQMIWQERANRIVMVANLIEGLKERCCEYWAMDVRASTQFGSFTITTEASEQTADYTTSILSVQRGKETRTIRHFHFTTWVDKNKPLFGATSLLAFHRKVHSFDDLKKGPMVVHCSAGVGRTGTFIVLDILMQQVVKEKKLDVYGWVRSLRRERMMMVQTMEQYMYVHDVLVEYINCGNTQISCTDFESRYKSLVGANDTLISDQFKILSNINTSKSPEEKDGLQPEHLHKNRNKNVIPDSRDRPYLPGRQQENYINAVFVDSFKFHDNAIVTQTPLPHTISDFWKLVQTQEAQVIIMLNKLIDGETPYWPEGESSEVYGDVEVTLTDTKQETSSVITRTFSVCKLLRKGRKSEPHLVKQFQLLTWPDDSVMAPVPGDLLDLMDNIMQWKKDEKVKPTKTIGVNFVHCIDGVNHSGMYCAMTYMLDRMKLEQDVDPFLAARYVSRQRPEFFQTEEQYRFLYHMAMEYMSRYNEYANFQ